MADTAESLRLQSIKESKTAWRLWGPYLSERQWGTVREDYSQDGNAWNYFTHDQSRSRTYRWGEDGIAGLADDQQRLCFSIAVWNYKDPILKERLFGLTNSEGNHGEDVKEYYFYLDNTPTHSYMKYLYKYPHAAYPYEDLVQTNHHRSRAELEYELINTGVFSDNAYFDVEVEYAKASPEDVLVSVNISNRGSQSASLMLIPQLWFRNTWVGDDKSAKPSLQKSADGKAISASHPDLGNYVLLCEDSPEFLFTENETNQRYYRDSNWKGYAKDAFHRYLIHDEKDAVNPQQTGTKSAAVYKLEVPAGGIARTRLRLRKDSVAKQPPFADFDALLAKSHKEADEFFNSITPSKLTADERMVMRQAIAGMLWSKQFYYLDNDRWLRQHANDKGVRNADWSHMLNNDVISMPDKWEYPWYAAWDLAFHTVPLAMVDIEFAKHQLHLMLSEVYMHGNGQLPAYEWNFGDVNPPVHAWAAMNMIEFEKAQTGKPDIAFLRSIFHKLLLNFTWWLNRKDARDRNVFEGGFLGLDNIGIFDRSSPLPGGGHLDQADGTAWMALFSQNMLQIAIELTRHDPVYAEMISKFMEHFLRIASAMGAMGPHCAGLWDEEDGFFYDVMQAPDGSSTRLRLRSMVGLLPLCATTVFEEEVLTVAPEAMAGLRQFFNHHPELLENIAPPTKPGYANRRLLAIVNEDRLRRILHRMLDESEFWGPHGIRSVSKAYEKTPFDVKIAGAEYVVKYLPAESDTGMFGGNSNWRGPVWMPVNFMLLRALHQFYLYYGDDFKVECPTGSGQMKTLFEVAMELGDRLSGTFLRDQKGKRPVFGAVDYFNDDANWRDCVPFYEYFHGDNGAGIGASHQTGWTGLIARLFQLRGCLTAEEVLNTASLHGLVTAAVEKSPAGKC
jgi:Glycosyl hydrolase family 63 C-terminal domain